tara:strand:+ start:118 stop:588 length:471 start_codon:yes stop_codon:yes gene_type:complete
MTEEKKVMFGDEIIIKDGAFKKDDPHKDIGKQKFRVRRAYTTWVEYDVVANSKEEAEDAVREHGGIDKIEWQEGYHNDEPVEVYATDWNSDHSVDIEQPVEKVAECVPYEDRSDNGEWFDNYEDPEWTGDSYRWKKTGDEQPVEKAKTKIDEEIPF